MKKDFGAKFNRVICLDGEWWLLHDGALISLDGLESVSGPVWVLGDFGSVDIGVEVVNGPASYAAPLIEKRLREDGVLDAPGHVIIHASHRCGDVTRALYTAMDVETYAKCVRMAERYGEHCLLFSFVNAMHQQAVEKRDGVVVFRHGRQINLLVVSKGELLGMVNATAFSTSQDDLEMAVNSLAESLQKMTQTLDQPPSCIYWFSWGRNEDAEGRLPELMQRLTNIVVDVAPEVEFSTSKGCVRTSIAHMFESLRVSDAFNGKMHQILFQIERWVPAMMAGAVAVCLGLLAVAWQWTQQAQELQAASRGVVAEMQLPDQSHLDSEATRMHSKSVTEQLEFLSELNKGITAPDIREVVRDIRDAVPERMRITGIQLKQNGKDVTVDVEGVAEASLQQAVVDLRRLSRALRMRGYQPTRNGETMMDGENHFQLHMTLNEAARGQV